MLTAYISGFISGVFAHKDNFDKDDPVQRDKHEMNNLPAYVYVFVGFFVGIMQSVTKINFRSVIHDKSYIN